MASLENILAVDEYCEVEEVDDTVVVEVGVAGHGCSFELPDGDATA